MATEFVNDVLEELGEASGFEARPWYNPYGDCVVFHASPDEGYADRVDSVLTLYRSIEDDTVIGFQLKDVGAIIDELDCDGVEVRIETEEQAVVKVQMKLLLFVAMGEGDEKSVRERALAYAEADGLAGEQEVEVPRRKVA